MAEIVIDTSAVVAVILDAPEKVALIRMTEDVTLVAPASIHWEIGNALSAMIRRGRLIPQLAVRALESYRSIPIRFVDVDLGASLLIASEHRLYAYDAYLIECAKRRNAPLLTLDRALARVASKLSLDVMEVV
jgi:predicted nucleic acid-binding protein